MASPQSSSMSPGATRRTLVVYYSRSGATAHVARTLAAHLAADLEVLHDAHATRGWSGYLRALLAAWRQQPGPHERPLHDPAAYDLVLIGTPVWGGHMTPAVRGYLMQQRARLPAVAFFVTSGDANVGRVIASLEAVAQRRAVASTGFNAGELADPAAYERKLQAFVAAITACPAQGRSVSSGA